MLVVLTLLAPPIDELPPVLQTMAIQPLPFGTHWLHDALQHSSFAPQTAAPHLVTPVVPAVAGAPPVLRAPPVPVVQLVD
jgi:hypothetical protein